MATIEQNAIQLAALRDQADSIKEQIAALNEVIIEQIQAAGDSKHVDTCVGRLQLSTTVGKIFTAPAVKKAQAAIEQWQAKLKAAKIVAEANGQFECAGSTTILKFSRKK